MSSLIEDSSLDSGLDMNSVCPRTGRETPERKIPLIRLEDDTHLMEIYEFGRKLGQGSFGVVYEATHIETQTKWAIKEVCRPAPGSRRARILGHEINILKQVNHAHIIHLQEVYNTAKTTYLVTELCAGGELKQLLQLKKSLDEDETRNIIGSLADAVVYLHKRDIVHRDLKLENILVKNRLDEDDNGGIIIKVADFGLSVQTGGVGIENMMKEVGGTLIYMAPEMMSGRGYSQWSDVWSIGVVMYMLLCGEPPFVSKTKKNLLKEIMNKEVRFPQPVWDTVSNTAKTLLSCLLKADPAYRMSAQQLLENPWITGDTNAPAMPSNVLEMMRSRLEQKETGGPTRDDSSLTSAEDTVQPSRLPAETQTPTHSHAAVCSASTSTTPIKGVVVHRDKRKNDSDTAGPFPHSTQPHGGGKAAAQPSAKQGRPGDRKDNNTGHKPVPKLSTHRPDTSRHSRAGRPSDNT